MPYWICPKCGSEESYEGTQLVTKVKGSGGGRAGGLIGSPIEGLDITPMIGASDNINITSSTEEEKIRKCKKCDTLLGKKDKRKTKAEKETEKRKSLENEIRDLQIEASAMELSIRDFNDDDPGWGMGCLSIGLIFLSIMTLYSYGFSATASPSLFWGIIIFGLICPSFLLIIVIWKDSRNRRLPQGPISVPIFCPHCGEKLIIDKELLGENIDCITCSKTFETPDYRRQARELAEELSLSEKKQTINNLVKCGNAVAILIGDSKVEISGGSPEEKEACRQWVEENHPEYTILD